MAMQFQKFVPLVTVIGASKQVEDSLKEKNMQKWHKGHPRGVALEVMQKKKTLQAS